MPDKGKTNFDFRDLQGCKPWVEKGGGKVPRLVRVIDD